ncbi:MAG: hypothetical protein N3D85_01460 [Candidatus Bathyarchaeota archaeon]|nr:hypothetical protein [Candidatus Bathyarchaeota archaeon]
MNKKKTDTSEPYFYMSFVLKGTEKQYLRLLKYISARNGASLIYQCRSLTYLRVVKDGDVNLRFLPTEALPETALHKRVKK